MLKICNTYDIDVFSKFEKNGDKYYNIRMKEESEKRKKYIESRRDNRSNKGKEVKKTSKTYDKHMEDEDEDENIIINKDKNEKNKEVFNEFRILYPGKKRGNETEFKDFTKKHKDWKEVLSLLLPAVKGQIKHRENIPPGKFVPEWKYLKTWINQRNWEEEFETESDPNEWLKK